MATITNGFALWLRTEMGEQGLSVRGLARLVDPENPELGRRNLHRYLSGKHAPGRPARKRIAEALGVSVETLPSDDEEGSGMTLDAFLKLRIRQIVAEEMQRAKT